MAQKVVHRKGEETHETENLVREILKMDWDAYEGILKEYAPLFIPKSSPFPSQSESPRDIFESESFCSCARARQPRSERIGVTVQVF